MNRKETVQILASIGLAYPSFQNNYQTTEMKQGLVELWLKQFEEFSYEDVNSALNDFIATDIKGFAPTIGMLKDMIYKSKTSDMLPADEAWNMVRKACKRGGYNSVEEFEKLPPIVQRIVGSSDRIKYLAITPDINWSVEASNFMKSYRERAQYERDYTLMPSVASKSLEAIGIHKMPSLTFEEMKELDNE